LWSDILVTDTATWLRELDEETELEFLECGSPVPFGSSGSGGMMYNYQFAVSECYDVLF